MRYFLKQKASELNITGRVFYQNNHTIRVQAVGNASNINDFVAHCKTGNPDSIIMNTDVTPCPLQNFDTFEVEEKCKVIQMKTNRVINDSNIYEHTQKPPQNEN